MSINFWTCCMCSSTSCLRSTNRCSKRGRRIRWLAWVCRSSCSKASKMTSWNFSTFPLSARSSLSVFEIINYENLILQCLLEILIHNITYKDRRWCVIQTKLPIPESFGQGWGRFTIIIITLPFSLAHLCSPSPSPSTPPLPLTFSPQHVKIISCHSEQYCQSFFFSQFKQD